MAQVRLNRHTPVLALGGVSMAIAIVLALWRLAGGPDLFPVVPLLAVMGWLTLMLWFRLIRRERKRFFDNWSRNRLQAHERAELNGLITERHYPVPGMGELPEDCRACMMGERCPVHGEDA